MGWAGMMGEEFSCAFLAAVGEVGHEVGIRVNLAGEEATGDLFVIAREIDLCKVLFEHELFHND